MRYLLLTLGVALLLAGCGSGGKQAQSPTLANTSSAQSTTAQTGTTPPEASTTTTAGTGNVVTHGRFHYPQILVTNYMKSCIGSAGGGKKKRDYCACTLDKLSNNVSTRDFAEIGLSNGRIPPRIKRFMSQAIADCANKL